MAIFLLSILAKKYMISTERLIGALGHGKGYVDSINAVDKQYLKKIMILIKSPNEENYDIKKISMHSVKGGKTIHMLKNVLNFVDWIILKELKVTKNIISGKMNAKLKINIIM